MEADLEVDQIVRKSHSWIKWYIESVGGCPATAFSNLSFQSCCSAKPHAIRFDHSRNLETEQTLHSTGHHVLYPPLENTPCHETHSLSVFSNLEHLS